MEEKKNKGKLEALNEQISILKECENKLKACAGERMRFLVSNSQDVDMFIEEWVEKIRQELQGNADWIMEFGIDAIQ